MESTTNTNNMESINETTNNFMLRDLINIINSFPELEKDFFDLLITIQDGIIHAKKLFEQLELDYIRAINSNFNKSLKKEDEEDISVLKKHFLESQDIVTDCKYNIEDINKNLEAIKEYKLYRKLISIDIEEQNLKDHISFLIEAHNYGQKQYNKNFSSYNQNVNKYEEISNAIK